MPAYLTSSEVRAVRLLAQGLLNKQVAHELGVTLNTVKVMNRSVYAKLGLHSRVEVALWAKASGLLEDPV